MKNLPNVQIADGENKENETTNLNKIEIEDPEVTKKLKTGETESLTKKKPKYGPGSDLHEKLKNEKHQVDEEVGEVCFSCGS